MLILKILAIAAALVVGLLAMFRSLNLQGADDVRDAVDALPDVPGADKKAALECFTRAEKANAKTMWYDLTAPLVMALVLPFVPRSADRLPKLFRRWDNNVSLNGDGCGWQDPETGEWHDFRTGKVPPGAALVNHSDPAYGGDCYYAPGHHPRSTWARYVWVGLRNRASQLSVDLGAPVAARPVLISGRLDINRQDQPGHFLLKDGDSYHFKSIEKVRVLGVRCARIRSYGYKLEIAAKRPDSDLGRAAAVAIGWSLKRWQG